MAGAVEAVLESIGGKPAHVVGISVGGMIAQTLAIGCPTLVIAGEEDVNAPPAAAQRTARAIPGALVKVMPGLGHFPPFEEPDGFNRILRTFLADLAVPK